MGEEKFGTTNPDADDEKKKSLLELLKEARRTWNRKGKSLENILDPNPNRVKEGTER